MENLKNPWIPCPKTSIVEEEEKLEKINEDIPDHSIEISLDSTNFKEEGAYLLVNLLYDDKKQPFGDYLQVNNIPEKITWKLDRVNFVVLHRKSVEIFLYRKRYFLI